MTTGNAKYSAQDIANWFLNYNYQLRSYEDEDTDDISNLKLQKLLYYAQGCYLALENKNLFDDNIVAWKHGPVVESIYQEYKDFKSNGINRYERVEIDEDTQEFLKRVYSVFGKYSAWGLRNMTHNETPWKETELNCVISNDSIKKYFKEHYIDE